MRGRNIIIDHIGSNMSDVLLIKYDNYYRGYDFRFPMSIGKAINLFNDSKYTVLSRYGYLKLNYSSAHSKVKVIK